MADKIKNFFKKPAVIVIEGAVIAACATGMIIAGISDGAIAEIPKFTAGVVGAVEAIITLIQGLTKFANEGE